MFFNVLDQYSESETEKEKENAVKLAEADLRKITQDEIAKKDREIIELQAKSKNTELEKRFQQREMSRQ